VTSWIWAIGRLLGVSTTAGVRAWLTLFVLAVMLHEGWFYHAPQGWSWIGSTAAVAVFGILSIVEIALDKIPGLDRLQERIALPWRVAAGGIAGACVVGHGLPGTVIGLVGGGALAWFGLNVKRSWRPRSPADAAPLPILSLGEDLGALAGAFGSTALPPIGYALFGWMAWLYARLRRRRTAKYRDLQSGTASETAPADG